MKITENWLDQFFNLFNQLVKMLLYLYQLFRGKYETPSFIPQNFPPFFP